MDNRIMPKVIIKKESTGLLSFYIAKRDVEETVSVMEFDQPDCWGGNVTLTDGSQYYIEPLPAPPAMPVTLRVKRN